MSRKKVKRTIMAMSLCLACLRLPAYDFSARIGGQLCYFNIIERGVCEITYADSVLVDGRVRYNTRGGYRGVLCLPYSVEYEGIEYYIGRIGNHAFQDCPALVELDIRHGCEEIGQEAFLNCGAVVVRTSADCLSLFSCNNLGEARLKIASPAAGKDAAPQPSGTIPTLYINTEDGAAITSKTVYLNATYYLCNAGKHDLGTPDAPLPLQIRGRGNSSWRGQKKPYKLKLAEKTKILGMKKDRNWALIGTSQVALNRMGFELGNLLGMSWNPSSQPVEVVINGDYVGLYLLMETVRTANSRVAIVEQPDLCANPDSLDGGWLLEVDNYVDTRQITVPECPKWRMRLTWHTPEELSDQQKNASSEIRSDGIAFNVSVSPSRSPL